MSLIDFARQLEPDGFPEIPGRKEAEDTWRKEAKHDLDLQRFMKNGLPDDYCEACQKNVANHETDHGLLCDDCYVQLYPTEPHIVNLGPVSQSDNMLTGRLNTDESALSFILAGNAYFTIRSQRTGTRFTYRVARPKRAREKNEDFWYVSLLNGPDNEHNYTYMANLKRGLARHDAGALILWTTAKCQVGEGAPSFTAFKYMLEKLQQGVILSNLEIWHEGRCGRCGRKLTVPESIERGIGPECASRI